LTHTEWPSTCSNTPGNANGKFPIPTEKNSRKQTINKGPRETTASRGFLRNRKYAAMTAMIMLIKENKLCRMSIRVLAQHLFVDTIIAGRHNCRNIAISPVRQASLRNRVSNPLAVDFDQRILRLHRGSSFRQSLDHQRHRRVHRSQRRPNCY